MGNATQAAASIAPQTKTVHHKGSRWDDIYKGAMAFGTVAKGIGAMVDTGDKAWQMYDRYQGRKATEAIGSAYAAEGIEGVHKIMAERPNAHYAKAKDAWDRKRFDAREREFETADMARKTADNEAYDRLSLVLRENNGDLSKVQIASAADARAFGRLELERLGIDHKKAQLRNLNARGGHGGGAGAGDGVGGNIGPKHPLHMHITASGFTWDKDRQAYFGAFQDEEGKWQLNYNEPLTGAALQEIAGRVSNQGAGGNLEELVRDIVNRTNVPDATAAPPPSQQRQGGQPRAEDPLPHQRPKEMRGLVEDYSSGTENHMRSKHKLDSFIRQSGFHWDQNSGRYYRVGQGGRPDYSAPLTHGQLKDIEDMVTDWRERNRRTR
jgi:hypothetical protein